MHTLNLSVDIETNNSSVVETMRVVAAVLSKLREDPSVQSVKGGLGIRVGDALAQLTSYNLSSKDAAAPVAKRRYARRKGIPAELTAQRRNQAKNIQATGAQTNVRRANDEALRVGPRIDLLLRTGVPLSAIASTLNAEGVRTRRGNPHTTTTVRQVFSRFASLRRLNTPQTPALLPEGSESVVQ